VLQKQLNGAAASGPVNFTIIQQQFTLDPVANVQGYAAQAQIKSALKNRMMDIFSDGTFLSRRASNARRVCEYAALEYARTPVARFSAALQ
jgi:hypothetical protein